MTLNDRQKKTIKWLIKRPVEVGHLLGFDKLTDLHNEWMVDMITGEDDETLQSHRGSYKTTCVSISLAIIILLFPTLKTMFMRKTSNDVAEVVAQVKKILLSEYFQYLSMVIWGCELILVVDRYDQITTNLAVADPRGTPQLVALGTQGSLTGKHFDRIFTDDIVNISDRVSKAERERTKIVYQELQNIINRGGRIFNTGTPWHKEDAFSIMPEPKKYDCYETGLIEPDKLEKIKSLMTASLFAANYELRHIASDDVIFKEARTGADRALAEQGNCHIDAAYEGSDYTAFTICRKADGIYYVLGKLWRKHVDDVEDEIIRIRKEMNAGRISCEKNGDKGYLGKSLRQKGERTHIYHENMNKFIKITTYLKAEWSNVVFVEGTDAEYIQQILDYNENAEHDDAPDSLACMVRELWRKGNSGTDTDAYENFLFL